MSSTTSKYIASMLLNAFLEVHTQSSNLMRSDVTHHLYRRGNANVTQMWLLHGNKHRLNITPLTHSGNPMAEPAGIEQPPEQVGRVWTRGGSSDPTYGQSNCSSCMRG